MDGDIVISINGDGECRIATSGGKLRGEQMVEVVGLFSRVIDALNDEPDKRRQIFAAIDRERKRQDEKWGEQNHSMLNGFITPKICNNKADFFRKINDDKDYFRSWFTILMEEVYEAFSETGPEKQREELVQVAAVAVQIIEYLDRKREEDRESQ
jgi:hypothetical protein